MKKHYLLPLGFLWLILISISDTKAQSTFHTDNFDNPTIWDLNVNLAALTPAQGLNDPAFNPWVINNLNFFTPTGPIQDNSLKITIQPGTDFDGLGLAAGYTGYDPFNVGERNITDAVALMNTNIDATGRFGIVLEFDYQTGGWLGDDYGTVLYSIDGGASWIEYDFADIDINFIDAANTTLPLTATHPPVPTSPTEQNAFSNIDGFSSGLFWHRAQVLLPPACDDIPNLRIGFRWRNIDQTTVSPDYVGVSFNIDNIELRVVPPEAEFEWTPDLLCIGAPINFDPSASTVGGGTSITNWLWEFPGGTPTTSTDEFPSVTYATTGSYEVSLRVVNDLGDTSLVNTKTLILTDCSPIANFIAVPNPVCSDQVITFTDISTGGTPTSWNWTFTGATPANATGEGPHDVIYDTEGTFTATLTVSNANGSSSFSQDIEVVDCECATSAGGTSTLPPVQIYFEDFDSGPHNWTMNQNIGAQGPGFLGITNLWYISDGEGGVAVGSCGVGGNGNNTIFLGNTSTGAAGGAIYFEFGFGGFFNTHRRSYTPAISTVGYQDITLNFDFIGWGFNNGINSDVARVEYSIDGGTNWTIIDPTLRTNCCGDVPCTGAIQGLWASRSYVLPADAEDIADLRIAFAWQNVDPGGGATDPSFAGDNIEIIATPIPTGGGGIVGNEFNISNGSWFDPTLWSAGVVPDETTDGIIASGFTATIDAANAEVRNLCVYGTLEIQDNATHDIDVHGFLLNEGTIISTGLNPEADVRFKGAASRYRGTGVNIEVDYQIHTGETTLETDLSCRSMLVEADFVLQNYRHSLTRNFTHNTGTIDFGTSTVAFIGDLNHDIFTAIAPQTFYNMSVLKTDGVASLQSAFAVENELFITGGTLDAQIHSFDGNADVNMSGGRFRLAEVGGAVLPGQIGTYTLSGGVVELYGTGIQSLRAENYHELEFRGSDVKTLTGNTNVAQRLLFEMPAGAPNYVDANGFVLHVTNPAVTSVVRAGGGHLVGDLRRSISGVGSYAFPVGSDGDVTTTFYERIDINIASALVGISHLTARFNATAPTPSAISPIITELGVDYAFMAMEGYWNVEPDVPMTGGSYGVRQYPSAGWALTPALCTQVKRNASPWDWYGSTRVTAFQRNGYTDFSEFGIGIEFEILPVTWLSFEGQLKGEEVHLAWETAEEYNNSHFEVERSRDGHNFIKIGEVAGKNQGYNRYAFVDSELRTGILYYRLRQVDIDNSFAFSRILTINNEAEATKLATVYPNPTNGKLQFKLPEAINSYQVSLYNAQGQLIRRYALKDNGQIDISDLPVGLYTLKCRTHSEVFTFKVIKE
ncbi:MAG: PKD domain-containing protein [Bernardetiaceae bacterium]|nr:PKD domain-containing protein [Bernardetiaceae bacterium]